LTLVAGRYAPNGIDTISSDPRATNLYDPSVPGYVALPTTGADVIIPAGVSTTVNIENAAGYPNVTFASLTCQAAMTIAPETSGDEIYVDPANPMVLAASNAGDTVTFSTPIAPLNATSATLLNTTANTGVVKLAGNVAVTTINATAGTLWIDSGANVTATTANASAGTLRVDGMLALADNGSGVHVSNTAALAGSGIIRLGAGTALTYSSIASSVFDGVVAGDGSLAVSDGSLTLNGANTYTVSSAISGGKVICGNRFALGGAGYAGGGEVSLYMTGGILDLNSQHATFTLLDGSLRTGVMVGDLNGTGGTITDNSTAGGGFLAADLYDNGGANDSFSGQFLMGANGQLPNMSIDVGGIYQGGGMDGDPPPVLSPDFLTLNGQTLDFGTFVEWSLNGPGAIYVGTLPDGSPGTTTMFAHVLQIGRATEFYPYTSSFYWQSTGTCTVSPNPLPGEVGAPAAGGAMVYGYAELDDGEMNVTDTGLTVASGGAFTQIGGTVTVDNGPTAQPTSGLTLDGAPQGSLYATSYFMTSGAELDLNNASFTANAEASFRMTDGTTFSATASPIAINCGSTVTVTGAGATFTVTDSSPVSIGSPVSVSDGPANVWVSSGADMSIGGSGTIDMAYCVVHVDGGTLDTARTFNPVGTATAGAELDLYSGNHGIAVLRADGDNSSWLAASASAAFIVSLGGQAYIDTNGHNVTIAATLTGAGELVKEGLGTLTLTAANSYTGYRLYGTDVTAGILNIQNCLALGDSTMGVNVVSGATLQMQGGIAVATTGRLYLEGDGAGGIGALNNLSGDNYWSGPIRVGDWPPSETRIESDAGALFITLGIDGLYSGETLTIGGAGNVSVTGALQIGASVGTVHKIGAGTMAWPGFVDYWLNGGNLTFSGVLTSTLLSQQPVLSAIAVTYGATLNLGGYIVTAGSAYINNGVIDVCSGALIVTTANFAFVPSAPDPIHGTQPQYGTPGVVEYGDKAIHDALVEGANYGADYGLGFWNGANGIPSSTAAGMNVVTAVGWLNNTYAQYPTFRGAQANSSQSLISYAYYGDADLDGYVDAADTSLWSSTFYSGPFGSQVGAVTGGMPEWVDGDWDQDGNATSADLSLWASNASNVGLTPLW